MASASQTSIRFSDHEPEDLSDYRPVNRPSLAALVLGLISVLAPFHLAFCVIPLFGVLAAAIGLLQLRNSDIRQSGRSLAVLGLFLSLLFCSWSVARESSWREHLNSQSRSLADRWFQVVRDGKLYEAHQLTMTEDTRIAPGASLEKHYAPQENASPRVRSEFDAPERMLEEDMTVPPNQQFDAFYHSDTVKQILELGSSLTAEFQSGSTPRIMESATINVPLDYILRGTVDSHPRVLPVRITLERKIQAETADWRVMTVEKQMNE